MEQQLESEAGLRGPLCTCVQASDGVQGTHVCICVQTRGVILVTTWRISKVLPVKVLFVPPSSFPPPIDSHYVALAGPKQARLKLLEIHLPPPLLPKCWD